MPRVGHGLHEDFLPLAVEFEKADAGDIAARMGERAHKTYGDHIAGKADDGNGPGRFLCGARRGIADAKDNVRGELGERRRDFRKLIIAKLKATGNDLQILPLNEAGQLELVKKRHHPWRLTSSAGYQAESVDAPGLLRSRDRRPKQRQCRRTSDEGDKIPPSHALPPRGEDRPSITSLGPGSMSCIAAKTAAHVRNGKKDVTTPICDVRFSP